MFENTEERSHAVVNLSALLNKRTAEMIGPSVTLAQRFTYNYPYVIELFVEKFTELTKNKEIGFKGETAGLTEYVLHCLQNDGRKKIEEHYRKIEYPVYSAYDLTVQILAFFKHHSCHEFYFK